MSGQCRARGWEADSAWWAETPAVASLDFGLATTIADFEGAFRLAHDRYVWRRYMPPQPSGRRLGVHHVLPSTKVVVAKAEGRVVGTITVVEDSCLGLPMDEAFGGELGLLRERVRRLAEGASLAAGRWTASPTSRSWSGSCAWRFSTRRASRDVMNSASSCGHGTASST